MRVNKGSNSASEGASSSGKSFATEMKRAKPSASAKSDVDANSKKTVVHLPARSRVLVLRAGSGVKAARSAAQVTEKVATVRQSEQTVARAQKSSETFAGNLQSRRDEAESSRPELRRFAEQLAQRLESEKPDAQMTTMTTPIEKNASPESSADTRNVEPTSASQDGASRGSSSDAMAAASSSTANSRASSIADQIEKMLNQVQLLDHADGPALELSLGEGHAAQIRVTRTDKGEVALHIDARSPEARRSLSAQIGEIREALSGRGLRVKTLEVA
jgi:hypothetical protein